MFNRKQYAHGARPKGGKLASIGKNYTGRPSNGTVRPRKAVRKAVWQLPKPKRRPAPAPAPAAPTPAPVAKPKPKPQPKKEPIVHSPEIQQAKERVQPYQKDIMTGKTSEAIYKKSAYDYSKAVYKEPADDYSKETYIRRSDTTPTSTQYDFSAKSFNSDVKKSQDEFTTMLS